MSVWPPGLWNEPHIIYLQCLGAKFLKVDGYFSDFEGWRLQVFISQQYVNMSWWLLASEHIFFWHGQLYLKKMSVPILLDHGLITNGWFIPLSGLVHPSYKWTLPPLIPLKSPGLFHPPTRSVGWTTMRNGLLVKIDLIAGEFRVLGVRYLFIVEWPFFFLNWGFYKLWVSKTPKGSFHGKPIKKLGLFWGTPISESSSAVVPNDLNMQIGVVSMALWDTQPAGNILSSAAAGNARKL